MDLSWDTRVPVRATPLRKRSPEKTPGLSLALRLLSAPAAQLVLVAVRGRESVRY